MLRKLEKKSHLLFEEQSFLRVKLYVVKDNYCVHWLYPGPSNKGHTLVDQSCSGQNIQEAQLTLDS